MPPANAPIEKIRLFRDKLRLTDDELRELALFRHVLVSKKDIFAERFYGELRTISEARLILDNVENPSASKGRLSPAEARGEMGGLPRGKA